MPERAPWYVTYLVIAVLLVVPYYVSHSQNTKIKASVFQRCLSGNIARQQINAQVITVLHTFIESARIARQTSIVSDKGSRQRAVDEKAAKEYALLASQLKPLKLADCEKEVK